MLSLSGHPIYRRTLTPLKESNVGLRNTFFRCYLGTLRTKKNWQCLGGPVYNQEGLIYPCYKTIHGLNGLKCDDYFEFNCHSITRSNHSFKLRRPLARVNCFLHSLLILSELLSSGMHFHEHNFIIFHNKLKSIVKFLKFLTILNYS